MLNLSNLGIRVYNFYYNTLNILEYVLFGLFLL